MVNCVRVARDRKSPWPFPIGDANRTGEPLSFSSFVCFWPFCSRAPTGLLRRESGELRLLEETFTCCCNIKLSY